MIKDVKRKYAKRIENLQRSINDYSESNNVELLIAISSLQVELEELTVVVDALEKQIPTQLSYEYDDEFECPACSYKEEVSDVKYVKFCPECGQKVVA